MYKPRKTVEAIYLEIQHQTDSDQQLSCLFLHLTGPLLFHRRHFGFVQESHGLAKSWLDGEQYERECDIKYI